MEKENENDKKVDATDVIADIMCGVFDKLNEELIKGCKKVIKHEETHTPWEKQEVEDLLHYVDRAAIINKDLIEFVVEPLAAALTVIYKSETLANYFGYKPCEIWYGNVDEIFYEAYKLLPDKPKLIKGKCLLNTYEPVHIQEFDDSDVTIEGNAFYRRSNGEYVVKMDGETFIFDGNDRFIPCKTHLPDANKNMLTWRYTILSDLFGRRLDALAEEEISFRNTVDLLDKFAKPMTLVTFNILNEDRENNTFMHYDNMIRERIDTFPLDERYLLLSKERDKILQASLNMDEVKHAFDNHTWEVKTNDKGIEL